MTLNCAKRYFIQIILFYTLILLVNCDELEARISLNIEGTGFHRYLIYQIYIDQFIEDCYITLYLQLPSALYVDVNELNHLRRLGISTACCSGETNVELFTEKAQIQNISICSRLTNIESTLKVPVHQRYRYASVNDKYINISLPDPKLLLGCRKRLKEYRISKIDLCSPCVDVVPKWREIPYVMVNNKDMENEWTIPIGETTMLPLVTYTTLLLTILCTIFLIHTIWKSMPKQHLKKE